MVASSFAQSSQGFTFQGRITKPDTTLLSESGLTVNVKILAPNDCVLWDENHSSVTVTDGYLNLVVGKGTPASQQPVGASFQKMADNTAVPKTGLVCLNPDGSVNGGLTSYTPGVNDARKVRVSMTLANSDVITADFNLRTTPFAVNAENLSGKSASAFVQTSANIQQARVESVYSRYATLDSILNGTYPGLGTLAAWSPTGTASGTTYLRGDGTWAILPAAAAPAWTDITGKPSTFAPSAHNHNASDINAGTLPIAHGGTGISTIGNSQIIMSKSDGSAFEGFAKCSDGEVLGVTSGAWDCVAAGGGGTDNTKLPLDGSGTMAGDLKLGGYDVLNAGHVSLNAQKTLRVGSFTDTQQTALVASPLASGHQGSVWWNSDRKALSLWDGTGVQEVTGAAPPTATEDGKSLKWNNTAKKWEYFTAGASGSGIATINGLSDSAQSLAVNTTGTSLTWAHGSATHTLSIPMADQTGVSAGLISKAQYDAFNGKMDTPSGTDGHFLKRTSGVWGSSLIDIGDIKNSAGNSTFDFTCCGAGKTLKWQSVPDRVTCENISITKSQVSDLGTIGGLAAKNSVDLAADVSGVLPVANGGTGTSTGSITGTGALTFAAGGSNQNITLTPSGTGNTLIGGKIGIGTSNPPSTVSVHAGTGASGRFSLSTSGTVDGQELALDFITKSNGQTALGGANTKGWTFYTFGDTQNTANNRNKLGWGYYDGSSWLEYLTIAPANGNMGFKTPVPGASFDFSGAGDGLVIPNGSNGQRPVSPPNGLLRYNYDTNKLEGVQNGSWVNLVSTNSSGIVPVASGGTGTSTGSITGTGALTFAAGGTNQNVTLTPSGTGYTILNGKVGIGEATPAHKLTISTVNEDARIQVVNWDANAAGQSASLYLGTYNIAASGKPSTVAIGSFKGNASSPGNVAASDWLGAVEFFGYGGTASTVSARVVGVAEGTFSNTSAPTSLHLQTTPVNSTGPATRILVDPSGNVGIGTLSPQERLHVMMAGANALQLPIRMQNPDNTSTGGTATGMGFKLSNGTANSNVKAAIAAERVGTSGRAALHFLLNNVDDATNVTMADARVTIRPTGSVGIGVVNPAAKLDVAGEVKFGNTASACNTTNEGQQRYNSTAKVMEYCNGTAWTAYGAGSVPAGTLCGKRLVVCMGGTPQYDNMGGGYLGTNVTCQGNVITVVCNGSDELTTVNGCPAGYNGMAHIISPPLYHVGCSKN
ncbi:MAG: hypothetical protein KF865_08760 [Bdellovibrionaceae bacterium]|nr:hypothetical protein [Pseudobdellovibrionaceae bacterium]